MKGKRIVVVGSLNIDLIVNVDHTPVTGETILAGQLESVPGGKGANQACAAGRLGADITVLGAVGKDGYADLQRNSLIQSGVDVSHLIEKQGYSTGLAFITVDKSGDNSIVVISGANMQLTPEDIDNHIELIQKAEIVILQLEIPLDTVCYTAKKAKEFGKMVILDPAPVPEHFPEELYRYIDIIKPNETEAAMLTGISDGAEHYAEAAEILRSRGVKHVLITLGEKGVYLNSESCGTLMVEGHKVKVVDTTAAGDSFTSALAIMLAEGKDLKTAARFANFVSSMVVTKKGAQSSIPTLEEVKETMKQNEIA